MHYDDEIPELDAAGLRQFGLTTGGLVIGIFGLGLPLLFRGLGALTAYSTGQLAAWAIGVLLILWSLLVWGVVAVLLGALITLMVRWLAALVIPQFMDSVTALAVAFGSLAALWLLASTVAALAEISQAFRLYFLAVFQLDCPLFP